MHRNITVNSPDAALGVEGFWLCKAVFLPPCTNTQKNIVYTHAHIHVHTHIHKHTCKFTSLCSPHSCCASVPPHGGLPTSVWSICGCRRSATVKLTLFIAHHNNSKLTGCCPWSGIPLQGQHQVSLALKGLIWPWNPVYAWLFLNPVIYEHILAHFNSCLLCWRRRDAMWSHDVYMLLGKVVCDQPESKLLVQNASRSLRLQNTNF